jgi:hypothetical protein
MRSASIDPEAGSVWRRARHRFARVRDWPANGNNPYSPLYCVSLLLAIGLIIEMHP